MPLLNADTEDAGDMRGGVAHEHNVRNSQIDAVGRCRLSGRWRVYNLLRACAAYAGAKPISCRCKSSRTQTVAMSPEEAAEQATLDGIRRPSR